MKTQHLIMEPLSFDDLEAVYALTSQEEVARYMRFGLHTDREETKALLDEYLLNKHNVAFKVIEQQTQAFVGVFVLKEEEDRGAYTMTTFNNPLFWNKGYSSEILEAIKVYAGCRLKAHTLRAYVVSTNLGSCRVLEKNKFNVTNTFSFEDLEAPLLMYEYKCLPFKLDASLKYRVMNREGDQDYFIITQEIPVDVELESQLYSRLQFPKAKALLIRTSPKSTDMTIHILADTDLQSSVANFEVHLSSQYFAIEQTAGYIRLAIKE